VVVKVGNIRVGILSYTDGMPEWAAGKDRPGIYHVPIEPDFDRQILSRNIAQKPSATS